MKTARSIQFAVAFGLVISTANAETIFAQDFENGLGPNESTFGAFSINDTLSTLNNGTMVMGHASAYGGLGGAATQLPTYSYYEVELDLRSFEGAELRFEFTGGIEKDFDGFNLLASSDGPIDPPNGLITPTAGSRFQYDADALEQHPASSPELGPIAWSSPADPSVIVKDLVAVFDLSDFDEQKVRIRFQFGTDAFEGGEGANFDNITVEGTRLSDTDGDGMPDSYEERNGLDKDVDDAAGDLDGDGLSNGDEFARCTDPNNADTDGDGLSDKVETKTGIFVDASDTGSDPTWDDTDRDGLKDGTEVNNIGSDPNKTDTDGDGFDDKREVDFGGDPTDPNSRPAVAVLTILGTGTGALLGGDLTDPEDDGDDRRDPLVPGDDLADRGWNFIEAVANEKSSFSDHEGAFNIFDNKLGPGQDKWCCNARNIVVGFEEAISLTHFTMSSANDVPTRDWKEWTLSGGESLDGPFELIYEHEGTDVDGNPGRLWPQRLQVVRIDLPRPSRPYTHFRLEGITNEGAGAWQLGEVELFGTVGKQQLFFDVQNAPDGENLVLSWESQGGELYNVRSETDPSNGEPAVWPIFDGHEDIEAEPPLNTLTVPRPADGQRFFVVEAFPAPPETIFSDDFESGQGDWTMGSDGSDGTAWELGAPSSVGPATANGGSGNCFATNLTGDYGLDANVWLRSPEIDLSGAGSATLNYFEFRDIEEGFDFGSIRVLDAADDSELAVISDTIDGVTADWELNSEPIPAEAFGKIIKLEFRLQSDDISSFAGWYLDDVGVTVP